MATVAVFTQKSRINAAVVIRQFSAVGHTHRAKQLTAV